MINESATFMTFYSNNWNKSKGLPGITGIMSSNPSTWTTSQNLLLAKQTSVKGKMPKTRQAIEAWSWVISEWFIHDMPKQTIWVITWKLLQYDKKEYL